MKKLIKLCLLQGVCLLSFAAVAARAEDSAELSRLKYDLSSQGAGAVVKEICSAVFVSKRDANRFLENSSKFWMLPEDKANITNLRVDKRKRQVSLTVGGTMTRVARYYDKAGCVLLPKGRKDVNFKPWAVHSQLPPASQANWPLGDRGAVVNPPANIDAARLAQAVDAAFAPDAHTAAFVVLYKGKIIAERYGADIGPDTAMPGWSMTKSVQATWVGLLEQMGKIDLFAPAPVAAWKAANDPRAAITVADLMRMSSGIACDNGQQWFNYDDWKSRGYVDSLFVFTGPDDAYAYSLAKPSEFPRGTHGEYTNCQPHVVGHIVEQTLAAMNETAPVWSQTALYDKLGIRSMIVEPDASGHLLTAAYSYATARDWARLGLLYAQDGVWNGERLLSRRFMNFVQAPAPGWTAFTYGGQFWVNPSVKSRFHESLPRDAYWMAGIEGQNVVVVPSYDLVIVRLGEGKGADPVANHSGKMTAALVSENAAFDLLIKAIDNPQYHREREVEKVIEDFFAALFPVDREQLARNVTDDFYLYDVGQTMTLEDLASAVERGMANGGNRSWILSGYRVSIDGDSATVIYHNSGDVIDAKGSRRTREWLESANLRRVDGRWRLSFLHSTGIKE